MLAIVTAVLTSGADGGDPIGHFRAAILVPAGFALVGLAIALTGLRSRRRPAEAREEAVLETV